MSLEIGASAGAAESLAGGGAIIGGAGLSAAGSLFSSALNVYEAGQNRKWQERMSNTAHQREVADLRAAGLNPLLSANHGGASTPSGNVAQVANPFESAMGAGTAYNQARLAKRQAEVGIARTQLENEGVASTNERLANEAAMSRVDAALKQERATAELFKLKQDTYTSNAQEAAARQGISESVARIPTYGASVDASRASAQASLGSAEASRASAALSKAKIGEAKYWSDFYGFKSPALDAIVDYGRQAADIYGDVKSLGPKMKLRPPFSSGSGTEHGGANSAHRVETLTVPEVAEKRGNWPKE